MSKQHNQLFWHTPWRTCQHRQGQYSHMCFCRYCPRYSTLLEVVRFTLYCKAPIIIGCSCISQLFFERKMLCCQGACTIKYQKHEQKSHNNRSRACTTCKNSLFTKSQEIVPATQAAIQADTWRMLLAYDVLGSELTRPAGAEHEGGSVVTMMGSV